MTVRSAAAVTTTALVLLATTLAGCGQSNSSSPPQANNAGTSVSAPATGSSPASNATVPASTVTSTDICSRISAAKASQLAGQSFTKATPESVGWPATCAYTDSNGDGVSLDYSNQNVDNTWQLAHTGTFTDISGIGDKAFWDNNNTLYAVSGQVLIQVNGLNSQDQSEALAKAFLNAVG